jgi:hypothetical protein
VDVEERQGSVPWPFAVANTAVAAQMKVWKVGAGLAS